VFEKRFSITWPASPFGEKGVGERLKISSLRVEFFDGDALGRFDAGVVDFHEVRLVGKVVFGALQRVEEDFVQNGSDPSALQG